MIGDQFLIGETFHLKQGIEVNGDIVGIGTNLILESGSVVNGNVTLVGSTLDSSGIIQGDLNVFAGSSHLMQNALIEGDINQLLHKVILDNGVRVMGEINTFVFPNFPADRVASATASLSDFLRPGRVIWIQLSNTLVMGLLALLIVILFRKPSSQIAAHVITQPLAAWGAGLFTSIGIPIVVLILILSLCLIPVGFLLMLISLISYLYGWLVLGLVFGKILQRWLHATWSIEIQSFFGAIGLGLLTSALNWIPCLGWFINFSLGCVGLGAIILSHLGTLPVIDNAQVKSTAIVNEIPKSVKPSSDGEPKNNKRINPQK